MDATREQQTGLALVGGGSTIPTVSERFTGPAWRLLVGAEPSSDAGVRAVLAAPRHLYEEIRDKADEVIEAARPCGAEPVIDALKLLAVVYGQPWADEAIAGVAIEAYVGALNDLPIEALQLGVADYNRHPDSRFFPRPGPLRAMCWPHAAKLIRAAHRAREAKNKPPLRPAKVTPEERAAIAAGLKELARPKPMPQAEARPRETPQQAAQRLHDLADAQDKASAPPQSELME